MWKYRAIQFILYYPFVNISKKITHHRVKYNLSSQSVFRSTTFLVRMFAIYSFYSFEHCCRVVRGVYDILFQRTQPPKLYQKSKGKYLSYLTHCAIEPSSQILIRKRALLNLICVFCKIPTEEVGRKTWIALYILSVPTKLFTFTFFF